MWSIDSQGTIHSRRVLKSGPNSMHCVLELPLLPVVYSMVHSVKRHIRITLRDTSMDITVRIDHNVVCIEVILESLLQLSDRMTPDSRCIQFDMWQISIIYLQIIQEIQKTWIWYIWARLPFMLSIQTCMSIRNSAQGIIGHLQMNSTQPNQVLRVSVVDNSDVNNTRSDRHMRVVYT